MIKKVGDLWKSATLDFKHLSDIGHEAFQIVAQWQRYDQVGKRLKIPAYVVGCIHYQESDFDFSKHLANGDPLTNSSGEFLATTHVPVGLGPFKTWEDAAAAALTRAFPDFNDMSWDLVSTLIHLEQYNGLGYRRHGINSPYIWCWTNHYTAGAYVRDRVFSATAVHNKAGCAALLLALKSQGMNLHE